MGIGDEIMASGHARVVHEQMGKRVRIVDKHGRPRWSPLWEGLSWVVRPNESGDFAIVKNGGQCRPYVAYPFTRKLGQRFSGWRARDHLGAISLTQDEQQFAEKILAGIGPFLVIEPNLSPKGNPNKQWGTAKWQTLVDLMLKENLSPIQMGMEMPIKLQGVRHIPTPTFRCGAAVLARARAAVLPEGGLHHAAAVLGVRAVVLFGGAISPETTGYEQHINIADTGAGSPCGRWEPCNHCGSVWSNLAPITVWQALQEILGEGHAASRPEEAQVQEACRRIDDASARSGA